MGIRLKARRSLAAVQAQKIAAPKTANNSNFFSPDDPEGSYTGVPADGGVPVQDSDDL